MSDDKKKPSPISSIPFDHPGKTVYVLLPWDEADRQLAQDFVEGKITDETKRPTLVNQLKIGTRRRDDVVYVALVTNRRVFKDGARYEERTPVIGGPVDVNKFVVAGYNGDGDDDPFNAAGFVDELQAACLIEDQYKKKVPGAVVRLSADKDVSKRTVKIFSS